MSGAWFALRWAFKVSLVLAGLALGYGYPITFVALIGLSLALEIAGDELEDKR